jgi:hypothetical protein
MKPGRRLLSTSTRRGLAAAAGCLAALAALLFKPGTPASVAFAVADPLLSDGFESGDVGAWSSALP